MRESLVLSDIYGQDLSLQSERKSHWTAVQGSIATLLLGKAEDSRRWKCC